VTPLVEPQRTQSAAVAIVSTIPLALDVLIPPSPLVRSRGTVRARASQSLLCSGLAHARRVPNRRARNPRPRGLAVCFNTHASQHQENLALTPSHRHAVPAYCRFLRLLATFGEPLPNTQRHRTASQLIDALLAATSDRNGAEIAALVGITKGMVTRYRAGYRPSTLRARTRGKILVALDKLERSGSQGTQATSNPARRAHRDIVFEWPLGWRSRAYRVQLEAANAGATEYEIATVRGWMLDPTLKAQWAGGAPTAAQLRNLDGIEIGARAWLRGRGRNVRASVPFEAPAEVPSNTKL
jgi:hypothetical protein